MHFFLGLMSTICLSMSMSISVFCSPTPHASTPPRGVTKNNNNNKAAAAPSSSPTFNDNVIFQAPANWTAPGTLYARTVQLSSDDNTQTLLATWENYSPEPPAVSFPIYRSVDQARTWTHVGDVTDTARGLGLRYQPFLYVLPRAFGGFAAGDLLLAGNSIPADLSSTHIEIYGSRDSGVSWGFVGHVAEGGRAVPDNGETPVWEPFLLLLNEGESEGEGGKLVCYYSDQRDARYGQKLVHQVSADGVNWGTTDDDDVVDDVVYPTYTDRPGMPVVAALAEAGPWIMTYEYGGGPVVGNDSAGYQFPVYFRVSDDPTTFARAQGYPLVATDGTVPTSSPYVVVDSTHGKVIVSSGSRSEVFVADAAQVVASAGANVSWTKTVTGESVSYSRSLTLLSGGAGGDGEVGEQYMLIAGGGALPPSTGNKVTVGVVDVSGY